MQLKEKSEEKYLLMFILIFLKNTNKVGDLEGMKEDRVKTVVAA